MLKTLFAATATMIALSGCDQGELRQTTGAIEDIRNSQCDGYGFSCRRENRADSDAIEAANILIGVLTR